MASRNQLRRALFDAAAILSSASNIARRAALSIDVDSLAGTGSPTTRTTQTNQGEPLKDQAPIKANPWPTQSLRLKKETEESAQKNVDRCSPEDSMARPSSETPIASQPSFTRQEADTVRQALPDHLERLSEKLSSFEQDEQDERRYRPPSHESKTMQSSMEGGIASSSTQTHRPAVEHTFADEYDATKEHQNAPLRATKVPSSRIARLLHYGSLGAGLAWGAAGSYVRGNGAGDEGGGKQFMSDDNVRRLVDKLSTMRGAALKLGQFMSIQDSNLLPEQIEQVMLRVQNSAHYMPQWQMERVMRQDLGDEWRQSFDSFEDVPFASASIGQVHAATLSSKSTSPMAGKKVAVKVQFPGVRESIGSDLANLRWLVSASALLPRGLFLDNTIRVMRRELDDECDYEREREMCKRFGTLLNGKGNFAVPQTVDELCSARVLTCEMMKGRPLTQASRYPQSKRDDIARSILELSLRELFTFRLMQTDPNWSNFLYNEQTGKIELIDFGATREYSKDFMDDWLSMLRAAISGDRTACIRWSEKIGYLTGDETPAMQDAHVESMIALGEPFRPDAPDPYAFAGQTITERVRAQIPLMLRERLTPPPEPTYSLNRKLSGAFLLCARLKANVSCKGLFEGVTRDYVMGGKPSASSSTMPNGVRMMHTCTPHYTSSRRTINKRIGNLADRWPRHVVEAVKHTIEQGPIQDGKGEFVSLAAEPAGMSAAQVAASEDEKMSLRVQAKGGENVRPDDAATSPTTAFDEKEKSTNVADSKVNYVRGIAVPAKPSPPGAEDCCMSGCARCVYDLYAEDLQDYQKDLSKARAEIMALDPPLSTSQWDESLLGPKPDEGGKRSAGKPDGRTAEERAQDEVDAVIGQLDPSMKAFLQLERALKRKGTHPTSASEQAQA